MNKIEYNQKYFAWYSGLSKHYYPRPTLQDLLFEENVHNFQQNYSESQIYCCNIDGMNEYQSIGVMHQIMMYFTACQTNNNSEKDITLIIICDFMGALKGCRRSKILGVIKLKRNETGQEVSWEKAV